MKMKKTFALTTALAFFWSVCVVASTSALGETVEAASNRPVLSGKININSATAEQLEMLPRIGTKTAQSIVEYRTENGPFKVVEGLSNVKGIGEKTLDELRSFIILEGDTTLKRQ